MKTIKCWKYGRWSWHFEKCLWCGTSKKSWNTRHKGKGLCINCFDIKRKRNPKRRENLKKQGRKFYDKVKDNPDFRKLRNEQTLNWQHNSETYKRYRKYRGKLVVNFNYFIRKSKRKLKRWDNGIEIIINGEKIKTPILPPRTLESEKNKTINEIEIFKKIYLKYKLSTP